MEQRFTGGANKWRGVTSTALKKTSLGGVEQWGLSVGCGLMYACRLVAFSDVMVTSMADGPGKIYAMIPLKMERRKMVVADSRECACGAC